MSECFFKERNLNEFESVNDTSKQNLFSYFYSDENRNTLIYLLGKIQTEAGVYTSIRELQDLTDNLLRKFRPHLMFISLDFSTLNCEYLTALDFINKEFIKINFNEIIKSKNPENIFTLINNKSNNIDNREKYFTITRPVGTSFNKEGDEIKINMDTQDMTVEDWRNLNVHDETPIQVSSKNFRNNNKPQWWQKQGQIRQYERDIEDTLPNVINPETPAYRNTGFDLNFKSV
jgi:hypothetical protein